MLRLKLIESGWRDELKAYCRGESIFPCLRPISHNYHVNFNLSEVSKHYFCLSVILSAGEYVNFKLEKGRLLSTFIRWLTFFNIHGSGSYFENNK